MRTPLLITCAITMLFGVLPSAASAGVSRSVSHPTAGLLSPHGVHSRPNAKSKVVARVSSSRPITGQRTRLPVLARKTDSRNRRWLKVRLPGRVLGQKSPPRTGWIAASGTMSSATGWRLQVDISSRELTVFRDGKVVRKSKVIVGAVETPTPRGAFFVEENIRLPSHASGAPFALALSARSPVFQEFEGGPGQIAIHGVNHIGGDMGTAASHGCVRMTTSDISWLARRIGQGVPVTIRS